jgi:hypothetical protein
MTGELAPARHVPSAATRGSEPVPYLPHGASLVARHTQADPALAILTSGEPNASDLIVMIAFCLLAARKSVCANEHSLFGDNSVD